MKTSMLTVCITALCFESVGLADVSVLVTEVDVYPESVGHILMEVPGPVLTGDPGLPPTEGVYRSPSPIFGQYELGTVQIVLREVRQRPLADPPPVVTTVGPDELQNFEVMAVGTAVVTGASFSGEPVPVELWGPVQTIARGKADQTTGVFDTEIISMNLRGEIPGMGSVWLQESPTLASLGQVSITDVGGGVLSVDSFFDVHTELSVDGETWRAANDVVRVELVQAWLICGVGPSQVHVTFEGTQEGHADDDDMDGYDEVETEILELDLRGHSAMGPALIGLRMGFRSLGEIEERINAESGWLEVAPFNGGGTAADSFFDVWPEIRLGNQVLGTPMTLPVETLIAHKPPQDGERYVNPYLRPVELIDPATGQGTGLFVVRQLYQPAPTVEHDYFAKSQMDIGLEIPSLGILNIALKGPSDVDVYFEGPFDGDAVDDDLNGRDEVTTQMKTLQLAGNHPALGDVYLNLSLQQISLGQIEEDSDAQTGRLDVPPFSATGTAHSYYDLFFEIEIPALPLTLHNQQPMRIAGTITHKPPGPQDELIMSEGPISLYNENGEPTGIFLTEAIHRPRPSVVEIDEFAESVGHILIEVPGPVRTLDPGLPATDGAYRSPSSIFGQYEWPEIQIMLQDVRQRPLADPPPVVTTVGPDEIQNFELMAPGTAVVTGRGFSGEPVAVELRGPVQTIVRGKADQTTGQFDAEIVSMNLSGEVPGVGTVWLQESPTLASAGQVAITDGGGGVFSIDSFFDVHTELSVDRGDTWLAANDGVRVELVQPHLIGAVGPSQVHVKFEGAQEGHADDDDMDGYDEVETELVDLDLRGHSAMGPTLIGLRTYVPSLGEIEERINAQSGLLEVAPFDSEGVPADSFFDVWPEISLGGQALITASTLPMETLIAHKPPEDGERYVNPYLSPVELIDPATGQGTGLFVLRQVYQPAPTVEHDYFPYGQMVLGLVLPSGDPLNVVMKGPGSVDVYFEGPLHGDAVDDDLNGRDEVTTQFKSLQMIGYHWALGLVYLNLNSQQISLGQIEENSDTTPGRLDVPPFSGAGTAHSYFDLFVEVQIPALGLILHNEEPMRISANITEKPPDPEDLFYGLPDVQLLNESGEPRGWVAGMLMLRSGPCERCGDFDGSGLMDYVDLRVFADSWLWEASPGDTNNLADFDCDGRICLSDFAMFASRWRQACP
ncbi:MAG: hypothetical protein ACYTEL_20580 [Planctomycetota bacterium]